MNDLDKHPLTIRVAPSGPFRYDIWRRNNLIGSLHHHPGNPGGAKYRAHIHGEGSWFAGATLASACTFILDKEAEIAQRRT